MSRPAADRCTAPHGHVFPPGAIAGIACTCGAFLRGHGERSMVRAAPPAVVPRV
jgi:hypothetical protein